MPPLSVLIVIPTMGMGGAEKQAALTAEYLANIGTRVEFVHAIEGPMTAYIKSPMISRYCVGSKLNRVRLLLAVLWIALQKRPHVTYAWLYEAEVCCVLAKLLLGCPLIMTERSNGAWYQSGFRWRIRDIYANLADVLICNSEGGAAYWRTKLSRHNEDKIHVVGNIVSGAKPVLGEKPISKRNKFVSIGRLTEVKDHLTLIRAWSIVSKKLPGATVSILGDGPLHGSLAREIRNLGLEEDVYLRGNVPGAENTLKDYDCLINCSAMEGQPNVVLEAIANGCPLILSDIPAHRECVNLESAAFFEVGDWNALANHVLSFPENERLFKKRAAYALDSIKKYGSLETGGKVKLLLEGVTNPIPNGVRVL